jgi:hypothetical protein
MNYLIEVPLFKVKKEEKNEINENVKWFSLPFFHPVVRQIPLSRASRGSCADPAWRGAFKVVWPMQEPPINRIAWKSMLQQAQLVYGKLWSL